MRATVFLLCLFLSITSCKDSEKNNDPDADPNQNINQNIDQNSGQNLDRSSQEDTSESTENYKTSDSVSENESNSNKIFNFTGTFINTDHMEDNSCECYCIEVNEGPSELCLKENDLYIDARFERSGDKMNVYFTSKSPKTNNNDIPWNKFDTGTPIAVLSPEGNGTLKLDWKGFSIDGKIAVDYALYGKKTLEGTYKKK